MKRSLQEVAELVVFGLIALLIGTGLLWLGGWALSLVGLLLKSLAGLLWLLLRYIVPVAIVAGLVYFLVRAAQGRQPEVAGAPGGASAPGTATAPAAAVPPPATSAAGEWQHAADELAADATAATQAVTQEAASALDAVDDAVDDAAAAARDAVDEALSGAEEDGDDSKDA